MLSAKLLRKRRRKPMRTRQSTFQAIGTHWEIQVQDQISNEAWVELLRRIAERIEYFDMAYSRFRADSLVTKLSKTAGTYKLPADAYKMLQFYEGLYKATEGKVTPLIGQAVADAGYDANYSLQEKAMRQPPRWEEVLAYSEAEITLKQPALLDFGAAGKGYLVDIVSDLINDSGAKNYLINAGGDILHRSNSELEVGLENPLNVAEAIGIVRLGNQSLCASAGSKRSWGSFHHIIDPDKLRSPQEIIATWVLADDTMTADGLATALFFTSPDDLMKQFKFSYAILNKDMSLTRAKDLPAIVFEAEA
jgi:thiamine biosynthesis lipoprotein